MDTYAIFIVLEQFFIMHLAVESSPVGTYRSILWMITQQGNQILDVLPSLAHVLILQVYSFFVLVCVR